MASPGRFRHLNVFLGIGAICLFAVNLVSVGASKVSQLHPTPPQSVIGAEVLRYDPYSKAYIRAGADPGFARPVVLVDDLIAPPRGFRISVITPASTKVAAGPPGPVVDNPATGEKLRASIRSLIQFEEQQGKVVGTIPTISYDDAPWDGGPLDQRGGQGLLGWHTVEVSDTHVSLLAMVPDRRYATDLSAYEKALTARLEWMTDKKFFPTQNLYKLQPGSHKLYLKSPLPYGVQVALFDGSTTVYADGPIWRPKQPAEEDDIRIQTGAALREMSNLATRLSLFAKHGSSSPKVNLLAVYPGGEYRGIVVVQQYGENESVMVGSEGRDLVNQVFTALRAETPAKPPGTMPGR